MERLCYIYIYSVKKKVKLIKKMTETVRITQFPKRPEVFEKKYGNIEICYSPNVLYGLIQLFISST